MFQIFAYIMVTVMNDYKRPASLHVMVEKKCFANAVVSSQRQEKGKVHQTKNR